MAFNGSIIGVSESGVTNGLRFMLAIEKRERERVGNKVQAKFAAVAAGLMFKYVHKSEKGGFMRHKFEYF